MVAEIWEKLFGTSNFRNVVQQSQFPRLLSVRMSQTKEKCQLKLKRTKIIPNYVLSEVIAKFVLSIVNH